VCVFAYVLQAEAIAARALTEMTLAPHVEDQGSIATPDVAVAEFDQWLDERPAELDKPWEEIEFHDLLFPRR
jgi:hypothetical protein